MSSNTHSVVNSLSPWMTANAHKILDWGARARQDLTGQTWTDPRDLVAALARDYLIAHPHTPEQRILAERAAGILHLEETAYTGLEVQLVDLSQLPHDAIDPTLGLPERGLLVNIDYAFGQQAEPILSNLISLFGRRIRSISVVGKAGGLVGDRGDVIVASGLVEQLDDELYTPAGAIDSASLIRRLPGRAVRTGRMLTVVGTLLQDRRMLGYYRHIWRCIGLEMEGAYYLRPILEAIRLGLLAPTVQARFLYYVSDLPLQQGEALSRAMTAAEGVPPLYAITREILSTLDLRTPHSEDTTPRGSPVRS